jgi:glycosyltransferase involved in cell wall biosynthesis
MPDLPPVSVVIATRDRPGLLERAVAHVLGQDYAGDLECVVVYDQCEPRDLASGTLAVLAGRPDRRLTITTNTRRPGLPGGRNSGCLAAKGDILAFCDDDDIWRPDKIRHQVELLLGSAEVAGAAGVACGIRLVGPGIDRVRPGPAGLVTLDHLVEDRVMEVHPSTMVVHRSTWLAAGPVDEQIPGGYAEDYDWLLRVAAVGPIAVFPEPLVDVEWHGGSFFFGHWEVIVDALRYLLERHPEFEASRRGRARIHGQIAFALAAGGRRRAGWAELRTVLRLHPLEKRVLVTVPVLLRLVSGDRVLRLAQRRGRGI